MTVSVTDEQEQLRAAVREFLAEKSPSAAVRRSMESEEGHDPAVWRQLTGQLGLAGVAVPEEYGGAGGGPVELGIVLEEMGRALVPSPYFATVALAGQALVVSDDAAAKTRWLPSIVDGSVTATLALAEEIGSWRLDDVTATATRTAGGGWTVSGTKMFVIDGDSADLLLVVACADTGLGLYAVEGGSVSRTRLEALDLTRRLGRIDLDGAPAVRVGGGEPFLRKVLDLAAVALAAEQVGGARACLDAAVEYAKIRVQFDRPIGSFQAIKHKCAEVLLEVEAAQSATRHAAFCAAEDSTELPVASALAASYCSQVFTHAAKENLQIHGGIGYTWEHDAHLYLKRAKSSELMFGTPAAHRARLADLVGI